MARKTIHTNIAFDDVKKTYYVTLDFGVVDGKQIKKTKTTKNLSEAKQILKLHEADKVKGALQLPKKITVSEWLSDWLNNAVIPNCEKTTVHGYKNIINQISAALGNIQLQSLKPTQIQKYYTDQMTEKGLSANTVAKHHHVLSSALSFAVKQDVLFSNPCAKTTPPKKVKPEIQFYDLEQLQKLLQVCKGTPLELTIYLGAFFGLRREEIFGLMWENVDLESRKLFIKVARTIAGGETIVKGTKNQTSKRAYYIVDEIFELLKTAKEKQEQLKQLLGEEYQDSGFVVTRDDGTPYNPNYISQRFAEFIKKHDLPPLTLHGLRHSFATLGNATGISMFDISKLLGHSTMATTSNIYTHLQENLQVEQINKMANALSGKKD